MVEGKMTVSAIASYQKQRFTMSQRDDRVYVGHMVDIANKAIGFVQGVKSFRLKYKSVTIHSTERYGLANPNYP